MKVQEGVPTRVSFSNSAVTARSACVSTNKAATALAALATSITFSEGKLSNSGFPWHVQFQRIFPRAYFSRTIEENCGLPIMMLLQDLKAGNYCKADLQRNCQRKQYDSIQGHACIGLFGCSTVHADHLRQVEDMHEH